MASRTPSVRRCWTMSTTSPSQHGGEGTDSGEVWMLTATSVILFMSVSLLGTHFFFLIKETHFSAYSLLITSRCAIRGICKEAEIMAHEVEPGASERLDQAHDDVERTCDQATDQQGSCLPRESMRQLSLSRLIECGGCAVLESGFVHKCSFSFLVRHFVALKREQRQVQTTDFGEHSIEGWLILEGAEESGCAI